MNTAWLIVSSGNAFDPSTAVQANEHEAYRFAAGEIQKHIRFYWKKDFPNHPELVEFAKEINLLVIAGGYQKAVEQWNANEYNESHDDQKYFDVIAHQYNDEAEHPEYHDDDFFK